MARVLAGERRALRHHGHLYEGVADPAAHRTTALFGDHLGNDPGADQVVDDGGARLGLEDRRGDQRGGH